MQALIPRKKGGSHLQKGPAHRHFLLPSPGPQPFILDSSRTCPLGTRLGGAPAADQTLLLPLLLPGAAEAGLLAGRPLCVYDNRVSEGGFGAPCALWPGGPGPGPYARKRLGHRAAHADAPSRCQSSQSGWPEWVACVFCPRVRAPLATCTVTVGLGRERDKDPLLRPPSEVLAFCFHPAGSLIHLELPLVYGVR